MADNTSQAGTDTLRTLEDGSSIKWPVGVVAYATTVGTPDVLQIVTAAAGLPVKIETGASIPVTDNSGSLTIDAPVSTPVFVRLSDGSSAISTLPVSLASVPSHAVTNAGTFAVQAAQSGTWTVDLGATDNAVLDAIAASLAGTLTVASHAVTNAGTFAVQASQSGTWNVVCTNAGTFAVQVDGAALTSLQLLDDAVATTGSAITAKGFTACGTDGTNARALKTNSSGQLEVDVLTLPALSAGTAAIGKLAANSGVDIGDVDVTSLPGAADDAAVSGNPIRIGGRAQRARRTAVSADADTVDLSADRYGRLQMAGIDLSAAAVQVTASGDTSLVAAPGAGSRLKILRIEASNSHASVAVTAGLKTAALNSGSVFGKKYLPALGGQAVWVFPGGHLLCGDNEAFNANLSAGSTTIEFTVYYETVTN